MDNGASSYRRFLDGDNNALSEIVAEYKDGLILYLNSYVKNIFIAEDLTEDTFFRLITKKPKFSEKSTFKTWLYSIARNVAVDHLRHNSKLTSEEIFESSLAEEESLERSYIKGEEKLAVRRALRSLPTDYRNVLWLVFFEEFSNDEASLILKKNRRQMKNLLYRAKKSLREELEKDGFIYEE